MITTKYYAARKRGALGIATALVAAKSLEEFQANHPDLEILASFETKHDALQYFQQHSNPTWWGR